MSTVTFAAEKVDVTPQNLISVVEKNSEMKSNRMTITNEKAVLNYIQKNIHQFNTKLSSNEVYHQVKQLVQNTNDQLNNGNYRLLPNGQ